MNIKTQETKLHKKPESTNIKLFLNISILILSFDVVNLGNYRSFDIDKTIVIDRSGKVKNAEYLAEVIGIDKWNVIQQKNKNYFLDVSLIIGRDYNNFLKWLKDEIWILKFFQKRLLS